MTTEEFIKAVNACQLQAFSKKAKVVDGQIVQKASANVSFLDPDTGKRHWLNSRNVGSRENPDWRLEKGTELKQQ